MQVGHLKKYGELSKVTVEITFLICMVIGRKSNYDLHSACWYFQMRWTIEMSLRVFKAATCKSRLNLMGFDTVLLKLMQLNCVQQSSISTQVNSSTITSWQYVCVSLLLAWGRHC